MRRTFCEICNKDITKEEYYFLTVYSIGRLPHENPKELCWDCYKRIFGECDDKTNSL